MGYIDKEAGTEGKEIEIESGKANIKAKIVKLPFIKETSIKSL